MSRAYAEMLAVSQAVGWPAHYRADLTTHDRAFVAHADCPAVFAWVLRECGTHVVTGSGEDERGRPGPWTVDYFTRCYLRPFGGGRVYLWDGVTLRKVAVSVAVDALNERAGVPAGGDR